MCDGQSTGCGCFQGGIVPVYAHPTHKEAETDDFKQSKKATDNYLRQLADGLDAAPRCTPHLSTVRMRTDDDRAEELGNGVHVKISDRLARDIAARLRLIK